MKDSIRKLSLVVILILFVSFFFINCRGRREWVEGQYLCWNWTPDNRIIYAIESTYMSKSKGGLFEFDWGYQTEGFETYICIIDKDGKNQEVIKRIRFEGPKKVDRVAQEIIKKNEDRLKKKYGKNWKWMAVTTKQIIDLGKANEMATSEIAAGLHPDPPLAHIKSIDWNAKNNLIVVAEEKGSRGGIPTHPMYIVDTQFNIVRYLGTGTTPAWSPDRKKIAYIVYNPGYKSDDCFFNDLWIMDVEGGNKYKVISEVDSFCWTPEGNLVICAKSGGGIIDLKGNYVRRLGVERNPHFSPDGKWIVYSDGMMRGDGSENRDFGYSWVHPKFSPDGKMILEDGWCLFDVTPDGKIWNKRAVPPKYNYCLSPYWVEYFKTPR